MPNFRCRSRRLRRQFESENGGQTPEQRMLLETVFDEAVTAFQSVLEPQRPPRTPSRPEVAEKATQIRQPPNSPDNVANPIVTFDFEPINDSDGFESDVPAPPQAVASGSGGKVTVARAEAEESAAAAAMVGGLQRQRLRRSLRKRRRVPSFKTRQTPRVAPKLTCCEDADDEASSSGDDETDLAASGAADLMRRIPKALTIDDAEQESSSGEEIFADSSGLQLKLKVLSEAQRTVIEAEITDWAKVGIELRSIADKFGEDLDGRDGGQDQVDHHHHNGGGGRVVARHEVDVLSLVNLMLPFSVPQSLWSALVSYAAWKIFKRFQ